ncbi:hypothetical protein HFP89_08330 [Wenzhouxiangella sp. XN79A]|uniref:hypothetical protein n=1 Tax=Wenzhouxiangella sp. XN79A TaxID=2724193 RepID=UPI00144A5FC0|nr:hypothetical protein [Wenzhouxiangella sp. XN79A]NKI35171.1 hypothetical protein [Wenzhouxiangella sp. XN79A]
MHLRSFLLATALLITAAPAAAQSPETGDAASCPDVGWLTGQWRGEVEGAGRILLFRFVQSEDDCVTGDVGVPNHDIDQLPLSDVEVFDNQIVHVRSDALGFEFKGEYELERITGDFIQNGAIFDLVLEPAEDDPL